VQTAGLPGRTAGRTVPDMFTRHRTVPDRATVLWAGARHEQLSATALSVRTEPAHIDRRDIRSRLIGSPMGLRQRLDRSLSAT
jgi:hypothetical protein